MIDLTNFKAFDFNEGLPYVSITNNGLTFNKSVIMKMNYPTYIKLLINENDKQMAIQACDEKDDRSVQFFKEKANGVLSVRLNSKDLISTIERICEWNLKQTSYRVNGMIIPEASLMLFNFSDAIPMT
ncbi:hypothetical protein B5E58_11250 [Tyzzerella sp. An114]|uniref:hypothetical protein n=1 Tax=Tyzzerella sp. An114 TaxID=1965545 RepID=UPI000B436FC7|nr:hypothetical protein [Tyzzerella sp. An114]OUQ56106.1 hypothetical protein B5E58_11250 [Tyzzerella sp. An114]